MILDSSIAMFKQSQHDALQILRNRTWRKIGLLTEKSEGPRIAHLCAILEDGSGAFLIPPLAAILLHFPHKFRPLIAPTLKRLIANTSFHEWPLIDQQVRSEISSLEFQLHHAHQSIHPLDLENPLEAFLALSHPSGFIRQKALLQFDITSHPAALALLVLRSADWVGPVAQTALNKLAHLEIPSIEDRAGDLVSSLSLISRLGRSQSLVVKEQLDVLLLSFPGGIPKVLTLLKSAESGEIRIAASQFLTRHHATLVTAQLKKFLTEGTPSEVLFFVRRARNLPRDRQLLLLHHLRDSKPAPIRRERLRLLAEFDPDGCQADLEKALSDPSKSIRSIARFHLQNWNQTQFRNHYLGLLKLESTSQKFRVALFGLAEVSPEEAHALAITFLSRTLSTSRARTCIQCLDLNSSEVPTGMILAWLRSTKPGLTRTAYKSILANGLDLPPHLLGAILDDQTLPFHSHECAMKLLRFGPKWVSLEWCLKGAANLNPRISQIAIKGLSRWLSGYSRSMISIDQGALLTLTSTLEDAQSHLEETLSANLRSILTSL